MKPNVTIVVVPRERFSEATNSLKSIYSNTEYPFDLIYVDGNSPAKVANYLQNESANRGFKLIRTEEYLSPNRARNIGLKNVTTKYVVFIDNDVLVTKGWLKSLVEAAEETQAWAVGPLTLLGEDFKTVHMAGGSVEFKVKHDKNWMIQRRPLMNLPLNKVRSEIKSSKTQLLEFHCMLANMDAFKELGYLDEKFMSMCEEDDFCMAISNANQDIYFEPKAVVSYVSPSPHNLAATDMPYFFIRWSEAWCQISIARCCEKWNLAEDAPFLNHTRMFVKDHRHLAYSRPKSLGIKTLVGHLNYFVRRFALGELLGSIMNKKAATME